MKTGMRCGIALLMVAGLGFAGSLQAGPPAALRTQTISLERGWNAVFLEVEPQDRDPAVVFGGTPVEQVAGFLTRAVASQYVSDPGADLFRRAGWGVWYGANRPDAFLKTLHAIHGLQGYLVWSREAFVWRVTGQVLAEPVSWRPNSFNLVGFPVASSGAPTFGQFFAGSAAHRHNRLYRLEGGSWRRVTDPTAEAMRSGEAFWIYCDGASTYQGPLRVQLPVSRQVVLSRGRLDITLRNESGHPLTPLVEHVAPENDGVPWSVVIRAADFRKSVLREVGAAKPAGAWVQSLPVLEAGEALRLPLEARREEMQRPWQASLLRISTDVGTETWLPLVAVREDLEEE